MMRRSLVALALVALAVSCTGSPEPPFGLDPVTLPEGGDEIEEVLSRMPDSLLGKAANEIEAEEHLVRLSYGEDRDLGIVASDFGAGTGDFPAWTVGEFLPRFVDSGEVEVDRSVVTGPLLYLTGTNAELTGSGEVLRSFWTMWFGERSSMWVFSVSAPRRDDGVAVVEAFVDAAS